MINYVNNAFDKTLKACDAQQFNTLVASSETERLILAHRGGDTRAKAKLPALTYMGVLDTGKYKQYLHQCEEQGTKPLGSRRVEFMRPTGLFMLDFDHVADPLRDGVILNEMKDPSESQAKSHCEIPLCARDDRSAVDSPVKLWEYIVGSYDNVGLPLAEWVALAHITPSGDGLRVVVKRTQGATIEQEQYAWCKAMKLGAIGIKPDAACKDISRLSFAPMQQEILYFNPSLLFGELPDVADYPDGTLFSGVSSRDGVILRDEGSRARPTFICSNTRYCSQTQFHLPESHLQRFVKNYHRLDKKISPKRQEIIMGFKKQFGQLHTHLSWWIYNSL